MLAVAGLKAAEAACKAEMIDAAFAKAMEKVTGLPDRQYQELLERMIAEAAAGYRSRRNRPAARISAGALQRGGHAEEKDAARMDGQFIVNINKRLSASGKKGTITLSEKRIRAAGGFILKIETWR